MELQAKSELFYVRRSVNFTRTK